MVCPSCVADGCDFAIQEPSNQPQRVRKRFFAMKTGGPSLRYLFVTHVESGKFLWVSRAFAGGTSEPLILMSALLPRLLPGERILADRLFRHHDEVFITSSGYDCERTRRLDSVRSRIERRIGRLATFQILSTTYRSDNYEFHADVVNVLCRVINCCGPKNPVFPHLSV